MQSFKWDKNFETGIKEVDDQHQYLVKLVNTFGDLIAQNDFSIEAARSALKQLADYTSYHFIQEEALMKSAGISANHFQEHHSSHMEFVRELKEISESNQLKSEELTKKLLEFLIQWLVYHILGSDQNMARQLKAIESGLDSAEAYRKEERAQDDAVGPLLTALKSLFEQVSARNKELVILNRSLEDKVAQRTRELSHANEKLHKLSYTDPLTNIPNRRFAMQEVSTQWDSAIEDDTSLVCMLIDVDKFKEVNDTCGHDAGDTVLIKLSNLLKESFRPEDSVCRLGGDEFIVICPGLDLPSGIALAHAVHERVKELRIPYDDFCWEGSISVGVAAIDSSIRGVSDLIKLADESVYLAKAKGKNCIKAVQLAQ